MDDYAVFDSLVSRLPSFVNGFFIKQNDRYQIRTKIGYARDFLIFFNWMIDSGASTAPDPRQVSLEDMKRLTDDDIDIYLVYLDHYLHSDRSGNTRALENGEYAKRRKLASLRMLFRHLRKKKLIDADPTDLTETPKVRSDKAIIQLSREQSEAMLSAAFNGRSAPKRGQSDRGKKQQDERREGTRLRDTAILSLFLGTGIRVSELVGINLYDVDFDEQSIIVFRKGGSRDLVYFPDDVKESLLEYTLYERSALLGEDENEDEPPADGPLFVARGKKRITVRRVQQLVKEYASLALPTNMKVSPHTLRKTFGTRVYREYRDLSLTQNALGHASSSTTSKHYVEFDKERLKVLRENGAT